MLVVIDNKEIRSRAGYAEDFKKLVVEGAAELATLCPVSKLTGFPMSLQQACLMVSDKNARLADALLQEIPVIRADESISDSDKLKLLVSRLDSGSFAENDNVAEILGNVAKEFFPNAKVDEVVEQAQAKINFSPSDADAGASE